MRVFQYTVEGSRHCKEGWAVEIAPGDYRDTYWHSDRSQLNVREIKSLKLQFDTDDFEQITGNYGTGVPPLWKEYASEDRGRIPSQNGMSTMWFIRKGASPDLETQIRAQLVELEQVDSNLRSIQYRRDAAQSKLDGLLAQREQQTAVSEARGSLQRRIDAGLAEPISDHEREQLKEITRIYERRFGTAK